MENPDNEKKIALYEALQKIATELITFTNELAEKWEIQKGLHFDFICRNFLRKQSLHLQSILLLKSRHDALLIARTMLEGMMNIRYFIDHDTVELSNR